MNEGVDQGFTDGERRVQRRIHAAHLPLNETAGDRFVLLEKPLGMPEKLEGMAFELPIVTEFVLGRPAEPCQPNLAHRETRTAFLSEKDRRCTCDSAIRDEFQTTQHDFPLLSENSRHALGRHGILNCTMDFASIQVDDLPIGGNPSVPWRLLQEAIRDATVEFRMRHALGRVADAQIATTLEGEGTCGSRGSFHHDDGQSGADPNESRLELRARFDPTRGVGDFSLSALNHRLSKDLALVHDAEEDLSVTRRVQHPAQRFHRLPQRARRALEFEGRAFALCYQTTESCRSHRRNATSWTCLREGVVRTEDLAQTCYTTGEKILLANAFCRIMTMRSEFSSIRPGPPVVRMEDISMAWTRWRKLAERSVWFSDILDHPGPACYELSVVGPRGGGRLVAYVGETGSENLRMAEYGRAGSHLNVYITHFLSQGYSLWYRGQATATKADAKRMQDRLIQRFPKRYYWNFGRVER